MSSKARNIFPSLDQKKVTNKVQQSILPVSQGSTCIEKFRSNVAISDINLADFLDVEGISDEEDYESDEESGEDYSESEVEEKYSDSEDMSSILDSKQLYRLVPLKENIPEASDLVWRAIPYAQDENNNATLGTTQTKSTNTKHKKGKNANNETFQNTTDVPESQIFLIDESNHLYRLRFKTQNAAIKAVQLRHRRVPDFDNDKFTQTRSKVAFNLQRYYYHTRYYLYVRRDRLIYFPRKYRRKKKRHLLSPKKLLRKKAMMKHPGSHGGKIRLRSAAIYLRTNDIAFKIRPNGPIPIVYTKPFVSEWDLHFSDITFDNYCDERKNKAQVYGCYKRDALGFTFDILNPTLDRIISSTQRGSGMEADDIVYFRSPKVLQKHSHHYCAIPRTTYYYNDPMINLKRDSIRHVLENRLPKWKEELLRKKLRTVRKQRNKQWDVSKTPGLNLMVEVCGHYVRARKDSVSMSLLFGHDLYECWAIDDQQSKLKVPKIIPPQCQTCTMLTKQVSACVLLIYYLYVIYTLVYLEPKNKEHTSEM